MGSGSTVALFVPNISGRLPSTLGSSRYYKHACMQARWMPPLLVHNGTRQLTMCPLSMTLRAGSSLLDAARD